MKPLRLAVVGTGHLGVIHARLAAANPHFRLAAVVDPLPIQRNVLAAELGTSAWDDHLALVGRVDAAILATPTQFHHRVARDLIRAGIHLLIEKPVTTTVAEADELIALAAHHRCVLQVGHVERFNPVFSAVAEHVRQPRYIEARRYCHHSFRSIDIGVALDLMIHDLDLVLSLVAAPLVDVRAVGATVLGPHEDVATARLQFADGCVANLSASRVSHQACRQMHIWSDSGFVGLDFATRTAEIIRPSDAVLRQDVSLAGLTPENRQQLRDRLFTDLLPMSTTIAPERNAIADEQTDFAESIRETRSPRVSAHAGRDALAAAQAVVESIASHTWVETAPQSTAPAPTPRPAAIPAPHWAATSVRTANETAT